MDDRLVLGFASVAFGWLLSETSQFLREHGARRRALNRILVELIELRHYQQAIDVTFGEMRKRWPISAADLSAGLKFIDKILPPDPGLPARYEAAVTELAALDPLRAFSLRSKERGPFLLAQLRTTQFPIPQSEELHASIEEIIRNSFVLSLDRAIRRVARALGPISWLNVHLFLRRKPTLPTEAESLFAIGERVKARFPGGA